MGYSYLKLSFNIKLVGERKVTMEIIHVHKSIHEFCSPVLFIGNNFIIEKSNFFKYDLGRLTIPYKIYKDKTYTCEYTFSSDTARYTFLKKLAKNLVLFSKSSIFRKEDHLDFLSNKLNMSGNNWYLY